MAIESEIISQVFNIILIKLWRIKSITRNDWLTVGRQEWDPSQPLIIKLFYEVSTPHKI